MMLHNKPGQTLWVQKRGAWRQVYLLTSLTLSGAL